MKILAFNASPRKTQSTTDIILDLFLKGAEEAGATTKKHYVTDLEINGCMGCFTCWTRTPGKRIHSDDMEWIIPELLDSDIIVHARALDGGTRGNHQPPPTTPTEAPEKRPNSSNRLSRPSGIR